MVDDTGLENSTLKIIVKNRPVPPYITAYRGLIRWISYRYAVFCRPVSRSSGEIEGTIEGTTRYFHHALAPSTFCIIAQRPGKRKSKNKIFCAGSLKTRFFDGTHPDEVAESLSMSQKHAATLRESRIHTDIGVSFTVPVSMQTAEDI